MNAPAFPGLDLLGTAVVVLDAELRVLYANPPAEHLLESGARQLAGQRFPDLFAQARQFDAKLRHAHREELGLTGTRRSTSSGPGCPPCT